MSAAAVGLALELSNGMLVLHRKISKQAFKNGVTPHDLLAGSISAHSGLFARLLASSIVSGAIDVDGLEAIMAQLRADIHAEIRGGQNLNS